MQNSKTQIHVFESYKSISNNLLTVISGIIGWTDDENWNLDNLKTFLKNPKTYCLVINKEINPVGFALIRLVDDEAEIIYLIMVKKYRNKGFATSLLNYFFQWAQNKSISRIFLEVSEKNLKAIKLYKNQGFLDVGLRKNYYRKKRKNEDAKIMLKNLTTLNK
jgi:ribosomal-protein-alanine N-acetyltransferase